MYVRQFPYNQKETWTAAEVCEVTGPLSYKVKLSNGQTQRRHVDHIRKRHGDRGDSTSTPQPDNDLLLEDVDIPRVGTEDTAVGVVPVAHGHRAGDTAGTEDATPPDTAPEPGGPRRSTHSRHPTDYFQ